MIDLKLCMTLEYVIQTLNLHRYKPLRPYDLSKPYRLLYIPNKEIQPSAEKVEDFRYTIESYETLDDLLNEVGSIDCGGMYTTVCTFQNNFNTSKDWLPSHMNTILYEEFI